MTYKGLNEQEIYLISNKILKDPVFERKCKAYIEDQGILNETMQIIASLCGISKKSNICNPSERKSLHSKYCGVHFKDIFIPYSDFTSIYSDSKIWNPERLLISKLEGYYIYLYHKKSILDDLTEIELALSTKEELEVTTKLIFEKNNNILIKDGLDHIQKSLKS